MDRITEILQDLINRSPEIYAVVLVTADGFPVSYAARNAIDVDRQSAVIASLASLAKRSTTMVGIGTPDEILITSKEGRMFVYNIGDLAALGVVTAKDVTAGLVLLKVRHLIPELEKELLKIINVKGEA